MLTNEVDGNSTKLPPSKAIIVCSFEGAGSFDARYHDRILANKFKKYDLYGTSLIPQTINVIAINHPIANPRRMHSLHHHLYTIYTL